MHEGDLQLLESYLNGPIEIFRRLAQGYHSEVFEPKPELVFRVSLTIRSREGPLRYTYQS